MFNGQRIAKLRKQKRMTQQQLADYLRVNDKTISKYERNKIFPGPDVLALLAQTFDVSLDYFFELIDEEFPIKKENFVALPEGYPEGYKTRLLDYMDLLNSKFNLK